MVSQRTSLRSVSCYRAAAQHTVVGALGVIAPVTAAFPEAAHCPPDAETLAVTLRAVAARLPLHWPTVVLANVAGAAQSVVAETETLLMVHVTPVGPPQLHVPAHARPSVPPAKYTCCWGYSAGQLTLPV